ncbi:MAG: decaprenyl-phosphate phosphoribosyltransferase [Candidatus Aminicenantes bacterium]|nr:decaprenyl-phosphate phosphoribosyltransferase [Candidatus Aminicenantes bacterium]
MHIKDLFISMRPKQWVKNVFIFAPMIFVLIQRKAEHVFHLDFIGNTLLAFALFNLVTGGIYIFNDILDREHDRHHPQKRNRPIASGRLPVIEAAIFAVVLLAGVLALIYFFNREFFYISLFYVAINILYSLFLKSMVIIDIMIIAFGFVLRVMAGAAVNRIALYPWILISTFLLAIFLALIKRRQELLKIQEIVPEKVTRQTLLSYTVSLLDQMISISTATTLIAYIMYVLSPDVQQKFHSTKLFYTVPFVIFGIFRYLFLSYARGEGESPSEIIYTDLPFTVNIILWIGVFVLLVNH